MTFARSVIGASRACAMVTMVLAAACGDDGGTGGSGDTKSSTSTGGTKTTSASATASASTTQTTGSAQSSGSSSTGGMGFTSIGTSDYETQATLAADANGNVVVVWVAIDADGSSAIGYGVSHDGGASWTAPAYVAAPDGRLSSSPSIAVDGAGVFTLAWLGFTLDFNEPDEHVYVSRLAAGADVFGAPVVASDAGTSTTLDFDRPSVTTDADDDVLLVFSDFSLTAQGGPASTVFARSADGTTFDRSIVADDATFGNLAHLCLDRALGPTAPLYLVHLGAGNTVTFRRSTDRGESWEIGGETGATEVLFQQPTCVASGNAVDVAWASGDDPFSPGDDTPADRVDVASSTDGGTGFTHPVTVTDNASQYLYPRIARGGGKRVVTFYAGTVGNPATLTEAASADGTVWARAPLATVGTFTVDLALASWLGGQTGVAIPGASVLAAFAENTQNVTHIAFAEAAVP